MTPGTSSTPVAPDHRLLFERSLDAMLVCRLDGSVVDANRAACEMLRLDLAGIRARGREALSVWNETARRLLAGRSENGGMRGETTLRRGDGTSFPADVLAFEAPDGLVYVVARDLGPQRQAEQALRRVSRAARLCFFEWNLARGTAQPAPEHAECFGLAPMQPLTLERWLASAHPDDRAGMARDAAGWCARARAGGPDGGRVEYRLAGEAAQQRWVAAEATASLDDGEPVVRGCLWDITERKHAEEAVRAGAERYRMLHESMRDAFVQVDMDGAIVDCNALYCEMLGYSADELRTRTYVDLTPPAWHDFEARIVREQILARGYSDVYEKEYRRKDGSVLPVELRTVLSRDAQGRPRAMWAMVRDVTERRSAEAARRESEAKLRSVLENMSEGLMLFDAAMNLVYQNPASLRIHGVDGPTGGLIRRSELPRRWLARDAAGAPLPFEGWPVSRVFRGERFQDQVLHVRDPASGHDFHASYNGSPIFDEHGRIAFGFITIREISAQVRAQRERLEAELAERASAGALREAVAELQRLNERLRDADRRKDDFLGMLSHELRNPLAPIRNAIYLLEYAEPGGAQARRAQAIIQRQTGHMARLVDDLLDVTRIARGKIELRRAPLDLRELVARAAEDFRALLQERDIRFELSPGDRPLTVNADATRITQVVGNLLHNAAKFTGPGDLVRLSVAAASPGWAEIRVRDSGAGIEPALLPTIFEVFVQGDRTLARTTGGLGLGLALVKGITELHGGSVAAASAGLGHGAEFSVRLPLRPAPDAGARPPEEAGPHRRRRVLVVDDNLDAAESLAEVLRLLGHVVDVAHDGTTAVRRALSDPPDVVLCDIGLPGMDGYEVARALSGLRAHGVQLVAVSGYAQPQDVDRSLAAGFDAHVAKPCDPALVSRLFP